MSPMSPQPDGMRRTRREPAKRDENDDVVRTDEWNILLRLGRGKRGKWITIGWTERVHPDTQTRGGWRGYPSDHTFPQERANHNDVMLWMKEVYLKAHPEDDPAAEPRQPANDEEPKSPLTRKRKLPAKNRQPADVAENAAEPRQPAEVAENAAEPEQPAEPQTAAIPEEPATEQQPAATTAEPAIDSVAEDPQLAEVDVAVVVVEDAAMGSEPAELEETAPAPDRASREDAEPWEYDAPEGHPDLKLVLQPDPFEDGEDPFQDPFQ